MKLNIQVDNNIITQSALLRDDIPGYNLPTLEFVLPQEDNDKDLILEEENPEIYTHLENLLVHITEEQDVAIFRSKRAYVRNKQKLLEYIYCKHTMLSSNILSLFDSCMTFVYILCHMKE